MSIYDDRMRKQPYENQDIYYAWIEDCKRLGISENSLIHYMSTVTMFFADYVKRSILDIDVQAIEDFINSQDIKLSRKTARLEYLKHFLAFTNRRYNVRWEFEIEDLMIIKPNARETRETTESAKPLTARQLIQLYKFFESHIQEPKWQESYTVFRLMYNFGLDKYEISKINEKTLNVSTGEFCFDSSKPAVKFDEELIGIFKSRGENFLPSNSTNVYYRLTEIEKVLGINITQKVIDKTRERFKIRCPECGEWVENDPEKLGFVEIKILNLGSLVLCKTCLEKEL